MAHIAQDSLATIYFTLTWTSSHASHVENFLATDVSFTRDILPLGVKSQMLGLGEGDSITLAMDPSEVPPFKPGKVLDMPLARFQPPLIHGRTIKPRIGRYYPKHFIQAVPGTRPDSATPFRVMRVDSGGFKANMNHPMADRAVTLTAKVVSIREHEQTPGGMKRWSETMLKGPGMQARLPESPTDFLGAEPFLRGDESPDANFYAKPRMVHHLDRQARANVTRIYGTLLRDGMDILDLMAGHESHLPEKLAPGSVTGLGMNPKELDINPVLTERIVYDLNETPTLPFGDESFDAVVCSVSVEYLTKPFDVFEEVGRVLKPGGVFALTFSNRWFEEKVIRIWTELHEFERMGLVCQYFNRTELYDGVTTSSDRGWPRPDDPEDRYAGKLAESDPVFAVWGMRK